MWLVYLWYFFGGCFLTNAIPHFVNGVMGRRFQSPFAKPPGRGLSSPQSNVIWGMINAVIGYVLLFKIVAFDITNSFEAAAFGLGVFLTGLGLAGYFGKFHAQ